MQTTIRKPNQEEQALKRRVMDELIVSRSQLLILQPFTGFLITRLDLAPVFDSRLPTASTNGISIFVNPVYFLNLNPRQRVYILAHEIWHCALLHFRRSKGYNALMFNYAADLEVDFLLQEQGFDVTDMLTYSPEWKGKSAEEIYHCLDKSFKRPTTGDIHLFNEEIKNTDNSNKAEDTIIDDDYSTHWFGNNDRQVKRWIVSAYQHTKQRLNFLPKSIERIVQEYTQNQPSWKEILNHFLTSTFGGERQWFPPNRRYIYKGMYLPGRKQHLLSVTIAIDTSGSTNEYLADFLSELNAIIQPFGRYEVTIIQCDSIIHKVQHFDDNTPLDIKHFSFEGGGCTSFVPVFEYIEKTSTPPTLLIYLTDGMGDAPDNAPQYPVLWALTSSGIPPANWGQVITLNNHS